ncbi:ran exchange factor prp20 pim1 [Pyrenophora seminiperda CCB06]|uniref:Ran exchange factor prp20 pim1 n=1 Tax=Pyrenophora seminiperda CCB06 TaxID=1302712 RepID=A0A3M7MB82_9PLEO|nr:ran exchange factor prp20 pim1 [Pyrenophora seminiperda CCB06]
MARATGSRAASAKPVEKKESKEVKTNGTGMSHPSQISEHLLRHSAASRRGEKKAEEEPATNGIPEETEADDEDAMEVDEVEPPPKKRKVHASQPAPPHTKKIAVPARSRVKKTETPAPATEPKAATKTKRKKDEESSPEAEEAKAPAPVSKKAKVEAAKPAPKAAAKPAPKPAAKAAPKPESKSSTPQPEAAKVNPALVPNPKGPRRPKGRKTEINAIRYTEPLKVFVFGEGGSGELGFGATKKAIDVKRPRYNEPLTNMNVVKVATGGMHVVALTKDNKILTWGVNDNGALGRDTSNADVKMRDVEADDSDSDEDETGGLNNAEATPTPVPSEFFPEDTIFVDIAAGDSCSFALTTEGAVYGWGTFRKNEGILGFERGNHTAPRPVYLDSVKKVIQLVCGTNHVYALDKNHHVYAWGNGQQNQLGRRVTERSLIQALQPNKIGFHDTSIKKHSQKITHIASGDYHGLAIADDGHIWAWGANNYCETGHTANAGADDASVLQPKIIHSLEGKNVTELAAGSHHNIAITKGGEVLVWGRCDGSQTGLPPSELAAETDEDKVLKNNGKPKILVQPTTLPSLKDIVTGACGPDHTIVIDKAGKAYSWGFSANYQTGQGTDDDIEVPTLIDNTAVRETKLTWAGCGGQYSMLASKYSMLASNHSTLASKKE